MYELEAKRYPSAQLLQEKLDAHGTWFHNFEFTNGARTSGMDPSWAKLHALRLPKRFDGLSVIDIGSYDGYFAFQAEARGASRVVANDQFVWNHDAGQVLDRFRLIRSALDSQVEERNLSVPELSNASVGTFDVALFLGVLYHTPDMVGYLERVRSIVRRYAVIETLVDMLDSDVPAAAFYPAGSVNDDASNWWAPNLSCVEGMLRRVGFRHIDFVGLWDVNTLNQLPGVTNARKVKSGRAVWHAHV